MVDMRSLPSYAVNMAENINFASANVEHRQLFKSKGSNVDQTKVNLASAALYNKEVRDDPDKNKRERKDFAVKDNVNRIIKHSNVNSNSMVYDYSTHIVNRK